MTTIYNSTDQIYVSPDASPSNSHAASNPDRFLNLALHEFESEMFPLLQSIGLQQVHTASKAIQFMGTRRGEGATTISRSCAIVAAVRLNKKVLFIENDYRSTPLLPTPVDVPAYDTSITHLTKPDGPTPSYESSQSSQSSQLHSPRLGEVLQHLRQRHDLIVIDSPPADMSLDGIAISRHVDGVVLVVEAENTRSAAVRKLQDRIVKSGGQVLGIVLNRRKYYIPSFIYKYL